MFFFCYPGSTIKGPDQQQPGAAQQLSSVSSMGGNGEADNLYVCFTNWKDHRKFYDSPATAVPSTSSSASSASSSPHSPDVPIIYFVTPTYPRREQLAELTRLGQTLMHVPNLHWIVADDNAVCNNMLDDLLLDFGKAGFSNDYVDTGMDFYVGRGTLEIHYTQG